MTDGAKKDPEKTLQGKNCYGHVSRLLFVFPLLVSPAILGILRDASNFRFWKREEENGRTRRPEEERQDETVSVAETLAGRGSAVFIS